MTLLFFSFFVLFARADLELSDAQYLCSLANALSGWAAGSWDCSGGPNSVVATACAWRGVTCVTTDGMTYVSAINLANPGFTLSGQLPDQVFNLPMLTTFNFVNHNLGSIPRAIGNLPSLTTLVLQRCNLTGTIPPTLGNIETLSRLDLSNNPLTGSIPGSLGVPTYLYSIYLSNTDITGTIPAEFGDLELSALRLQGTGIDGGCFPRQLITPLLGDCNLQDSSFYCDCDAPVVCKPQTCCVNIAGLLQAGLICEDGGWTSNNSTLKEVNIDIQQRFGLKTVTINGDLNIGHSLSLLNGNLAVTGELLIQPGGILMMQANTSLTVSKKLNIGNVTLKIIQDTTDLNNYVWKAIKAQSIVGEFQTTTLIDSNCYEPEPLYSSGKIDVNFTEVPCPAVLTSAQILAMIFVPICVMVIISAAIVIYVRPEIIHPEQEKYAPVPTSPERAGHEHA